MKETNPQLIGHIVFGAEKEYKSGMMDVVIPLLLQLDENDSSS